jgi:hypothetical protein
MKLKNGRLRRSDGAAVKPLDAERLWVVDGVVAQRRFTRSILIDDRLHIVRIWNASDKVLDAGLAGTGNANIADIRQPLENGLAALNDSYITVQ